MFEKFEKFAVAQSSMVIVFVLCTELITQSSLLFAPCSLLLVLCFLLFVLCSLLFALCSLLLVRCLK